MRTHRCSLDLTARRRRCYNSALVAQEAGIAQDITVFTGATLGVLLLSYALQGWVLGIGPLASHAGGWIVRALPVVSGFLLTAHELVIDLVAVTISGLTCAGLLWVTRLRHPVLP